MLHTTKDNNTYLYDMKEKPVRLCYEEIIVSIRKATKNEIKYGLNPQQPNN